MGGKKRPSKQSSIRFLWSIIISLKSTSNVMGKIQPLKLHPLKHIHYFVSFFQPSSLHNFQWKLCSYILSVCSLIALHDILIWYFRLALFAKNVASYTNTAKTRKIMSVEKRKLWWENRGKRISGMNCVARIRI